MIWLAEWILAIIFEKHRRDGILFSIYPIMFGTVNPLTDFVGSVFEGSVLASLPHLTPTATVARAKIILSECSVSYDTTIDSMTVYSIKLRESISKGI